MVTFFLGFMLQNSIIKKHKSITQKGTFLKQKKQHHKNDTAVKKALAEL